MFGGVTLDQFNNLQTPDIYLAQKNKHIIACLNGVSGLKVSFFLNDMNTCSFSIPRMYKNKLNNAYNELETKMLILIVGFGWFEVKVSIQTDGGYEMKNVSGKSLEYELSGTNISIEANSADIDYTDYTIVQFYNIADPSASLLHRIIKQCPGWTIGHVDDSLKALERSFSVEDTDAYSFLVGEVSEAFECFFIFDSYKREINAYKIDDYGRDTNIYLSFDNLNQAVTVDVDDTKIKTVFKVSGGEGVYIEEINPNGTDLIYNYSYYLNPKYMKQSTIDAYHIYQAAYDSAQPAYLQAMSDINTAIDEIALLTEQVPDDLSTTDWSLYGLTLLNTKLAIYENTLNEHLNAGYGDETSPYYNDIYLTTYNIIAAINSAIATKKTDIASWEAIKADAEIVKNGIQSNLNIANNYFTQEEWLDLCYHNYVSTYSNDNYIITNLDTDKTRIQTEQKLLEIAKTNLDKASRPQYSFTSTTNNLLNRKEFQPIIEDFELGNYLRVEINEEYIAKMRLISYSLDFENLSDISVEYSDMINVNNILKDSQSILAQASATSNSVTAGISQWNKAVDEASYTAQVRKEGLDASLISITNSKDQDIVIDGRGITGRQWNAEAVAYDNEQFRLTKNLLAFTDDNWKKVRSAFGKISVDGYSYYGLIGDAIVGNIFIGEKLKLTGSGAGLDLNANDTITGMQTQITANKDGLLSKVSSIDYNGNTLVSMINQSSSKISQTALNIDLTGYVTIANIGTAGATTINGSNITTGILKSSNYIYNSLGMSINLTNGIIDTKNFKIDGSGNTSFNGYLTSSSGTIGGWTIGPTSLINYDSNSTISVYKNGNLSAYISKNGFHTYNPNASGEYFASIISVYMNNDPNYGGSILAQGTSAKFVGLGYAVGAPGVGPETGAGYGPGLIYSYQGFSNGSDINYPAGFTLKQPLYVQGKVHFLTNAGLHLANDAPIYGYDTYGGYHNIFHFSNYNNVSIGWENPGNCNIYGAQINFGSAGGGNNYGSVDNNNFYHKGIALSKVGHAHGEYSLTTHIHHSSEIIPDDTGSGNINFSGAMNAATPTWCDGRYVQLSGSDFRLKKNFESFDSLPDELYFALMPKQYEFICDPNTKGKVFGLVAQEVINTFEKYGYNAFDYNLVQIMEPRRGTDENLYIKDNKLFYINYNNLHSWSMHIIQKQQNRLNGFEERLLMLEMR